MPVSGERIDVVEPPGKTRYALLRAVIHPAAEGGYWAELPALHCVTEGETLKDTEMNMFEAVAAAIEDYPAIEDYFVAFEVQNA